MAKKSSSNKLLLIGAIGVGAYLLYKRSASPAAGIPQTTATTGAGMGPTLGTGSASTPTASVANDPRITEIKQWISTLTGTSKFAPATAALANMSQDEIAGLYDIVHNDFYGNGITTPAQRTFWDTWRVKYQVL